VDNRRNFLKPPKEMLSFFQQLHEALVAASPSFYWRLVFFRPPSDLFALGYWSSKTSIRRWFKG
jgi:hypothetical protein